MTIFSKDFNINFVFYQTEEIPKYVLLNSQKILIPLLYKYINKNKNKKRQKNL